MMKFKLTRSNIGDSVVYTSLTGTTYSATLIDVQQTRANGYARVQYRSEKGFITATVPRTGWDRISPFPKGASFVVIN